MNKNDKNITIFLIIFLTFFALLIIGKNIYDAFVPQDLGIPKINVEDIKKKIKDAGLEPKEALYYEIIDGR